MGKLSRSACIFLPMVGTIASLICLIIVGLGGTDHATLNDLYFFRANTSHAHIKSSIFKLPSLPTESMGIPKVDLVHASSSDQIAGIKDFYHVNLWNYCSGDFFEVAAIDNVTFCSPRQKEFWFNPIDAWKLNNTVADKLFGKEFKAELNTYRKVAKWMFVCYIIAIASTVVEILIGFLALWSRLGSLVTSIFSTVSSLFLIAFALTSTILYGTLVGVFNIAMKDYQIHTSLGKTIYIYTWLAVAFSLVSGFFWLISSCC